MGVITMDVSNEKVQKVKDDIEKLNKEYVSERRKNSDISKKKKIIRQFGDDQRVSTKEYNKARQIKKSTATKYKSNNISNEVHLTGASTAKQQVESSRYTLRSKFRKIIRSSEDEENKENKEFYCRGKNVLEEDLNSMMLTDKS